MVKAVCRRYTPLYEGHLVCYAVLVAAQRFIAREGTAGPMNVVEIGVGSGVTAHEMVENLRHRRMLYNYIGVDNMQEAPTAAIDFKHPHMTLIVGDSTDPAVIAEVPEPIHFLFIDGDHRFAGAMADVLNYGIRVPVGFLMAMHDAVGSRGVRRALAQTLLSPCWKLHFKAYERTKLGDMTPGLAILERVQ